jgi:hypothetical protein
MSYFGATRPGRYPTGRTPRYSTTSPPCSRCTAPTRPRGREHGNTAITALQAGRRSHFSLNPKPVFTIWDGGGVDTLDFSQTVAAVSADLNEGRFSDAFGMTNNVSIAFGVVIENARAARRATPCSATPSATC